MKFNGPLVSGLELRFFDLGGNELVQSRTRTDANGQFSYPLVAAFYAGYVGNTPITRRKRIDFDSRTSIWEALDTYFLDGPSASLNLANVETLLLMADDDGNPQNGIQLTDAVHTAALKEPLNDSIRLSWAEAAASSAWLSSIANLQRATSAGIRPYPSSASAAREFFSTSWLREVAAGTWVLKLVSGPTDAVPNVSQFEMQVTSNGTVSVAEPLCGLAGLVVGTNGTEPAGGGRLNINYTVTADVASRCSLDKRSYIQTLKVSLERNEDSSTSLGELQVFNPTTQKSSFAVFQASKVAD